MTTDTFLAIFLPVSFLIFTVILMFLFHYGRYIRNIDKTLTRIETAVKPIAEIDSWLRKRGLDTIVPPESGAGSHSLPPNEADRRDELLSRARDYELTEAEAEELRCLLQKDAQSDFANGVISGLAFLGIMAGIIAIIDALSKKKDAK